MDELSKQKQKTEQSPPKSGLKMSRKHSKNTQ